MRKFKPIENTSTMEIIQGNQEFGFSISNSRVYRDPKNQISPRVYKVIRGEKSLKIFLCIMSFSIMFFSIIMFTLVYTKIGIFETRPIGYLILFGTIAFVAMTIGFKNLIENIQWSHTVQRYRDAISAGDYTSSNTFHLAYRRIVLKSVNLTWILTFVLTYLGLITAIIYGLYASKKWVFDSESLKINFDWETWLDRGFGGNTSLFCLISVIIMASLVAAYIIIRLLDKKRLADIDDFLGEKSVEIHDQIEKARRERNKMWLRVYLVVVALTILLPILLIIVGIWRGIIKRKKKVVA